MSQGHNNPCKMSLRIDRGISTDTYAKLTESNEWMNEIMMKLPILCPFHADTDKTVLSSLGGVGALWPKLETNQDCRRHKISKLNMFSFFAVFFCVETWDSTKLFRLKYTEN